MFKVFGSLSSLMVAAAVVASASTPQPSVQVVKGAKPLSAQEKAAISGKCGCTPDPTPVPASGKPGYGFGTTGHYGPPGQGFTPSDNWRNHAAGDGKTPSGKALPPRAFN